MQHYTPVSKRAFTLIELSIVLVIIGLIVGGVLVGRDLIRASEVRAQVSQIEKLNSAVNTFKGKYNNYLPGDIPEPDATNFGFKPRGPYAGEGDGNGVIEGVFSHAASQNAGNNQFGEPLMFWVDLSTAKLSDGSFTTATSTGTPSFIAYSSTPNVNAYYPKATIGNENYVVTYSGITGTNADWAKNGTNYFAIAKNICIGICAGGGGTLNSYSGMTVQQAYNIDKKIDDGLPQSGTVAAVVAIGTIRWASSDVYNTPGASTGNPLWAATTAATAAASGTCYDNGNVNGATQQYSITTNNGSGVNCGLSFKMQ